MNEDENELLVLTMWGCLQCVLMDYNVDISHITPKMGVHMADDYMELLEKHGHIRRDDGND